MSDLIRDYNDKQQKKYASNLEMPKVVAPAIQDAAPVSDKQLQVTTPQQQPSLQQMVAPPSMEELGLMSNFDATAEFNARLGRQLPTLLSGQPSDAERKSNAFYDWVGGQIEDNRKRNAAQAIAMPSLQQFNTPAQQRPSGFGQNVLKTIFGDPNPTSDDGILGNEFNILKGRFGQFGGGILGGAMYALDNTLGLGIVRNSLLDTGANLASQAAGWAAGGGILDTLFKTGDVGKAIMAGTNRQKQALQNIYGDGIRTGSFMKQGLMGRDLGALGNLSGDTNDDYKKLYGSSPAAAGLDKAFFGRELTEQESKDYEKLTGYAVKQAARLPFKPEETAEYQEILGRVPEDFKTKMLLRNLTGLVVDIKTDDILKPLINLKPATLPNVDVVPELPKLSGTPERLQLGGSSPNQRMLPPKERNTAAADQYIGEWLRRGESVETKPMGVAGDLPGRGIDPWVTIDATAVRIPEALPGRSNAALPAARSSLPKARTLTTPGVLPSSGTTRSALPSQTIIDDIVQAGRESINNPLSVTDVIARELRTSSAKSLVVSPPIAQVVTPQQIDVAAVLRQQYMRRVEPGQYLVQRLGTIADTDPIIALKSLEPAPQVANPVRLALPPAKTPIEIANTAKLKASVAQSEGATTTQFWYEDRLIQDEIRSGLLPPQREVKQTPRSMLPKTETTVPDSSLTTKIEGEGDTTQQPTVTTPKEPEALPEVPEVPAKLIPSSKAEILKAARERLEASKKAERGEAVEQPPKVEPIKEETTTKPDKEVGTNDVVVKDEVPAKAPIEGETPKQRMLREAREKLDAEKASRRLETAVEQGFAKPVEGGVEVRVDVETPKGQELLNEAIDFDALFNKTYDIEDLDTMISMVSRAAAGAPISFVGKVAPIGEVSRSQKEVYRFASLVPHPTRPGKPLLAPTKSMVAEYAAKYGKEHPYASVAIADSSMKYLTKNGGARRHKSLADLAQEQTNPLYRKILSPTGTPIPIAVIEKFEKQLANMGGQALVKTSSDTVSAIDTTIKVAAQSQDVVKRSRFEAQKFIDDNNLGIRKNLSAQKLNELLDLYESKGIEALPDDAFTRATLTKRKVATQLEQGRDALTQSVVEPKREVKIETAAKKITKTETLEDFEDAVVKLEDMEPTLKELEAIEKKVSSLPIYDHRKKLATPSHTKEVIQEAMKSPEVAQKQEVFTELVKEVEEVVVQEQELFKTKQAIDVAIDNVDAQLQARVSKLMDKYGLPRVDAEEFDTNLQNMLARNGQASALSDEKSWTRSRKAAFKGLAQSLLDVDDMRTSPNYEAWRQSVIDDGDYEKAAAWLYQNRGTKKATNPVLSIDADGNFDFMSGSSTFFAAMDSGLEKIPVQIVSDARLGSKAIEWTKHPLAKGERTKLSVADLDRRWKTDRVEAGGEGGIGTRYNDAREFMKANDKINMSEIVVKPDGSIVFKDGRHRFAVLRDEGVGVISVMAENPQYLIPQNPKLNPIEVVKQLDEIPEEVKTQPVASTTQQVSTQAVSQARPSAIENLPSFSWDNLFGQGVVPGIPKKLLNEASSNQELYQGFDVDVPRKVGDTVSNPNVREVWFAPSKAGKKNKTKTYVIFTDTDSFTPWRTTGARYDETITSGKILLPENTPFVITEVREANHPGAINNTKTLVANVLIHKPTSTTPPVQPTTAPTQGRRVDTSMNEDNNLSLGLVDDTTSGLDVLDDTLSVGTKHIDLDSGEAYTPSVVQREPLSRQNISDALSLSRRAGKGSLNDLALSTPPSQNLKVSKRRNPDAALPTTVGQAISEFKDALATVNRTGTLDDRTQIKLNNAVYAMESLEDKSYAQSMREVVARITGRGVDEGSPFMTAAVEMLNDGKPRSRDEIADILSYAIGTKDVKFAANLDDAEVLKFSRFIAQRPETMSRFDHLYVGHGTGVVEHGTWSLEARPGTGYKSRELIQHVIDNTYPRGTEVGVAACETGCPKRIQDAVPPLHRVVSRGAVQSSLENLQRLIEGLSDMPTTPKVMDVLAEYDGLLREALTANKQRGIEILEKMSLLEDDFNNITKRNKFANEQRTRAQIKKAQASIEKELLGDC